MEQMEGGDADQEKISREIKDEGMNFVKWAVKIVRGSGGMAAIVHFPQTPHNKARRISSFGCAIWET